MKTKRAALTGWFLIVLGVLVVAFSSKIVFPGLELLLGIETIVGKDYVVYRDDGSYMFTNPIALAKWIFSVAAVGAVICSSGIWLLVRSRAESAD